jgi:demethylspheroidene O-methyltransferase
MASRRFQAWAAQFPLTRRLVRKEGEAMFDLLAGFCHSQVLMALVQLDILPMLAARPDTVQGLAAQTQVPEDRMEVLLRAAIALKLLKRKSRNRVALTRSGAALIGVPGLTQMIAHHDVLYSDLADPAAFFRGEVDTKLARFWPYVFGGEMDPEISATYSDLMAQSQVLVAEDTLRAVSLKDAGYVMDIGGGTGAFLEAIGRAYPSVQLSLFDLPQVAPEAQQRFAQAGMEDRTTIHPGSFKTGPVPEGADTLTLIRVLYDHADATVTDLLRKCFAALPSGGQLLISEPMSGGATPIRSTDVYFSIYTLAMQTGKTRSAQQIQGLCEAAGFEDVRIFPARRPFVTQCVTARKS